MRSKIAWRILLLSNPSLPSNFSSSLDVKHQFVTLHRNSQRVHFSLTTLHTLLIRLLTNTVEDVINSVTSVVEEIGEVVGDVFEHIVDAIKDALNYDNEAPVEEVQVEEVPIG